MSAGNLYTDVKRVIDNLDPEGLLAVGAPADEYNSEARIFEKMILAGQAFTPAAVRSVWVERFYAECGLARRKLDHPLAEALCQLTVS